VFLLFALLYVLAAFCFGAAAFGFTYRKVNLIALGLLFMVLPLLLTALSRM
jgi:hypothetical protein